MAMPKETRPYEGESPDKGFRKSSNLMLEILRAVHPGRVYEDVRLGKNPLPGVVVLVVWLAAASFAALHYTELRDMLS